MQTPNNPNHNTFGGNDTKDKIFLLSIDEAEKYFNGNADRSLFLLSIREAEKNSNGDADVWWLRSPGSNSSKAIFVHPQGTIYVNGENVSNEFFGVRPALWVNLKSDVFKSKIDQIPSLRAELQAKQQSKQWASMGLCRFCGGKLNFSGNKCKNCGKAQK